MPFNFFKKRSVSLNNLKGDAINGYNGSDIDSKNETIATTVLEENKETSTREIRRLRKKIQDAEDENNVLKLKIEILLDMVTEKAAEKSLLEKELQQLKFEAS